MAEVEVGLDRGVPYSKTNLVIRQIVLGTILEAHSRQMMIDELATEGITKYMLLLSLIF